MKGTQQEAAMRLWKNWFPIALAIVWMVMAALAMVDFATFNAATRPQKPVVKIERPVHSALSRRVMPAHEVHD